MKPILLTDSARYVKIVEWSDEDQCFVGHCPGVIGPCCPGDDEGEVYRELCQIADECAGDHPPRKPPFALAHRRPNHFRQTSGNCINVETERWQESQIEIDETVNCGASR